MSAASNGRLLARIAVEAIDKASTAETSGIAQVAVLPSLADARARIVELLRQRPAPKSEAKVETDAQAMARWARSGRRADARRTLALVGSHVDRALARALLVSPRTVARWRRGAHAPTPRHWRQLLAVRAVLIYGGRS
jgi:hypothetical protein